MLDSGSKCKYNLTHGYHLRPRQERQEHCRSRPVVRELVRGFEWASAPVVEDAPQAYAETRYQALGKIDGRLHMVVFTVRGESLRIISLRKANAREVARYEKA
ncbi:PF04365 family protein [Bordetella bronchiseptica 7E71]|nr:PF04365 family protein [Bordetella bronchiseptica 7E71]